MERIQNKFSQKEYLRKQKLPTSDFLKVNRLSDLEKAVIAYRAKFKPPVGKPDDKLAMTKIDTPEYKALITAFTSSFGGGPYMINARANFWDKWDYCLVCREY